MGCDKLRHRKVPKFALFAATFLAETEGVRLIRMNLGTLCKFGTFVATFWVKMGFVSQSAGSNVCCMHAVLGSFSFKTRPSNCQLTGQKPVSSYLQVVSSEVLAAR